MRYWDDAPYPALVKTVAHVAFEVDDLDDEAARSTRTGPLWVVRHQGLEPRTR
jgi:hypothetical protein